MRTKKTKPKVFVKEGDDELKDTIKTLKSQIRRLRKENKRLKEENSTLELAFHKSIENIEEKVEGTPVEDLICKKNRKAETVREKVLRKYHPNHEEEE